MREGWDATDSVYFVVTSITTVGFGDLMPSGGGQWCLFVILLFLGIAVGANFVASMNRSLSILAIKIIHMFNQRDLRRRGFLLSQKVQRKTEFPARPKRRRLTTEQLDALKQNKYSFWELDALSRYLRGEDPSREPVAISYMYRHLDRGVINTNMYVTNLSEVEPSQEPESPVTLSPERLDCVVIDMEGTNLSEVEPSQEPESPVTLGRERSDYVVIDIDMMDGTNSDAKSPEVSPTPSLPSSVIIDIDRPG